MDTHDHDHSDVGPLCGYAPLSHLPRTKAIHLSGYATHCHLLMPRLTEGTADHHQAQDDHHGNTTSSHTHPNLEASGVHYCAVPLLGTRSVPRPGTSSLCGLQFCSSGPCNDGVLVHMEGRQ